MTAIILTDGNVCGLSEDSQLNTAMTHFEKNVWRRAEGFIVLKSKSDFTVKMTLKRIKSEN